MLKLKFLVNHPLTQAFLISLFFFSVYTIHSLNRHYTFNSHAFDLGIYTQSVYLYSQNIYPFNTLKNMILLGDHFEPILILLSPIYRLYPDPRTLLILQAAFVSASAIPIFLIAKHKLSGILLPLLITITYLSSASIYSAIFFDFHTTTISVLPLSMILYSWYFKKWGLYLFSVFFSLLFKEDIPIFLLGLGLFQVLKKQFVVGTLTILTSITSFLLIKSQLMPLFWVYAAQSHISTSVLPLSEPIDLLLLIFTRPNVFIDQIINYPSKLKNLYDFYSQFGFLPLLSPLTWFTVIPYQYLRYTSNASHFWSNSFHYNANLMPFITVGTIFIISRTKVIKYLSLPIILLCLFSGGLKENSYIYTTFKTLQLNYQHRNYIYESLKKIPADSKISAQSPLVPRLANRTNIYLFPKINNAEYIILDLSLDSYPLTPPELKNKIQELNFSRNWQVVESNKNLFIFKRVED